MPTEIICSNDKNSFALQQKEKNNIALLNYKWIFYNQDRVWHLIFDIDKKYKLGEIKEFLQKKFSLTPTWLCYTDNGIQFSFMFSNVLKTDKQMELAKEAKRIITTELAKEFNGIDEKASNRIRGFWRNPLMHKYKYTGNFIELLTLKKKILTPYSPKPKPKEITKSINKKSQKKYPQPKIKYNIGEITINYPDGTNKVIKLNNAILELESLHKGNRNWGIWYNLMANTQSTQEKEVLALAEYFNAKAEEPLQQKELHKIVNSVVKYNKVNKNYIYIVEGKNRILNVRTYKNSWKVGKMGFKKIKNLDFMAYKEEVRKRQQEAGKQVGVKNLEEARKKRQQEAREKVYKAIEELKKRGEKITVRKVKELAQVSIASAQKYLKQARKEGII
jgi:hypothetical protein